MSGVVNVMSNKCNETTSCLVQPIGAHCCEVMYFGCCGCRSELGFLNCDDVCKCVVNKIQNPILMAQSTQIKSVISAPIKDFIHHYSRPLFNDIPRVGRSLTAYPGRE